MDKKEIKFLAEIRKVETKKLVSNDIEHKVTLNTSDSKVVDLSKLPADTMLEVTVRVVENGKGFTYGYSN